MAVGITIRHHIVNGYTAALPALAVVFDRMIRTEKFRLVLIRLYFYFKVSPELRHMPVIQQNDFPVCDYILPPVFVSIDICGISAIPLH